MPIIIRMTPNQRLDRQLTHLFASAGEPFALELWAYRVPHCWYCGVDLGMGEGEDAPACCCWRCGQQNYLRAESRGVVISSSDDPTQRAPLG